MRKAFRLNFGVMIHCEAGAHRAAAVSAATLMTIRGVRTDQVISIIKRIRHIVDIRVTSI